MRKLEELNLVDDFLFVSVLSYPGIGEAFARELLETVFERKFGKLTVVTQKAYYGDDTDKHGARLDVYIEEAEDWQAVSAVYDVDYSDFRFIPINLFKDRFHKTYQQAYRNNCFNNLVQVG